MDGVGIPPYPTTRRIVYASTYLSRGHVRHWMGSNPLFLPKFLVITRVIGLLSTVLVGWGLEVAYTHARGRRLRTRVFFFADRRGGRMRTSPASFFSRTRGTTKGWALFHNTLASSFVWLFFGCKSENQRMGMLAGRFGGSNGPPNFAGLVQQEHILALLHANS